jgi:hypothetical protein
MLKTQLYTIEISFNAVRDTWQTLSSRRTECSMDIYIRIRKFMARSGVASWISGKPYTGQPASLWFAEHETNVNVVQ